MVDKPFKQAHRKLELKVLKPQWKTGNKVPGQTGAGHDDYYPGFDYLRGLLALMVVLGHDNAMPWVWSANFAVQVFFALSGWLIGGMLLRFSPKDLPRFYFNRAIRIWIPYYIALALLIGASLLHDKMTTKWMEFVLYMLSFVYNLFGTRQLAEHIHEMPLDGTGNHFWSVNAEEQFYLMAPILIVLAAPQLGRSILTWSLIAVLVWLSMVYTNHIEGYASIVFGVLSAILVDRYGPLHLTRTARAVLFICAGASAIGMAMGLDYVLLAPVCSIGIVLLLAVRGPQTWFGAVVGGMSYPLYLNHWIGIFIGHALFAPFGLRDVWFRVLFSTLLSVGLAVAHYWFIDRRMLAKRRQMFSPKRGLVTTCTAYALVIGGMVFGLAVAASS